MIKIVTAHCKRCGRPVATTTRSTIGLDRLKAKWGIICQGCTTPEEQHRLLMEQEEFLARGEK